MNRTARRALHPEAGMALLAVLVILVVIGGSSSSFIWFMNQQQTRAGIRLRAAAATAVAEAGVHRALYALESVAPDGQPGREWRPKAYSERVKAGALEGRFTISLADDPGGAIVVTSMGEVAGVTRRLRARVYLASPALLSALYGTSFIRLETPPAATFILPYGAGIGDRPWIHMAAGREIWFATTEVSINDPTVAFDAAPGPVDAPGGANTATAVQRPTTVRLLLARGAELTLGEKHERVDVEQLRFLGVSVEGAVFRAESLPPPPEVDRAFYQARAAANVANAGLNQAAGAYLGDADLERKSDSLYSPAEFSQLLAYLKAGLHPARLAGIVYVTGGLGLHQGQSVTIVDGALVTEGTVQINEGASLEIVHSAATRTLPALLVLEAGALLVTDEGRLRAHGLVYAGRVIDIGKGARVDIVGSVLGNDRGLSFRNAAATVVIRYDPAVLGTPGLRVAADTQLVAWVAAWEELP